MAGAFVASLLAAGCAVAVKDPAVPSQAGNRLTPAEIALLHARLDGAAQPRLSLAMSGGGIRSALVNFGVLKALYDDGVLDQVDLVSSVSGGSYMSYWLYGLQHDAPGERFGSGVLGNDRFLERVCEVTGFGNFFTYPRGIGALRHASRAGEESRARYVESLARTFDQDGIHAQLPMRDLAPMMRDHKVPYLIVNATTDAPIDTRAPTWNERLFELTPLHHGSIEPDPGHVHWDRPHPFVQAIAASGAAQPIIKREFAQPYPASAHNDKVYLGDGGWSDNLGAAAPLLRGTRTLIVVDAQYDPKDTPFEAWVRLVDKMQGAGYTLQLDRANPRAQATGVYAGRAEHARDGGATRIAYVKMDLPRQLRDDIYVRDAGEQRLRAGEAEFGRVKDRLGHYEDGAWRCDRLAGMQADVDKFLYYNLASYVRFRDARGPRQAMWNWEVPLLGAHAFPRTTTSDQSMDLDEARAFIALGYFLAKGRVGEVLAAQARDES